MRKGKSKGEGGVVKPKTRKDYEEAKAFDAACAEQLRRHFEARQPVAIATLVA